MVRGAVHIRTAVGTARNNLLIAARRVNHYQEVLLPVREQIIDQTQRQYNAMELGVFQLILAGRLVSEGGELGATPGGLEMP